MGNLVVTIRKQKEMIQIRTREGDLIKIKVKDHRSGNKNLTEVFVQADKSLKITRHPNEQS